MNPSFPALYECRVNHTRVAPKRHAFDYRVFMIGMDLDDPPQLSLLSFNRFNLFTIDDRDHIRTDPSKGIRGNLVTWLAEQGVELPGGSRILLLTFPRVLGYSFNPVSFYYVCSESGDPVTAVAEVTNTYREMKLYPIPPGADGKWDRTIPKDFYVSPFSDPNDTFRFRLGSPGDGWTVHIDNLTAGAPTLLSSIRGERRELTSLRLAWYALKYPLISLAIILRIHLHALFLYLKGIPHFPKSTPIKPSSTATP